MAESRPNQHIPPQVAADRLREATGLVNLDGHYMPIIPGELGSSVQSPVGYYGNARAEAPADNTTLATRPTQLPANR